MQGNRIGTDATGTLPVPNNIGVLIDGSVEYDGVPANSGVQLGGDQVGGKHPMPVTPLPSTLALESM